MKFSGGLGGLGLGSVSLLVFGLAVGCAESKATTPAAPPPPTVIVAPVVRQDVPLFIEAVGSIDGFVDADIRARARGILQSQRYKDGAAVQKGQLLFTIEPSEFQIAADSAKAAVARAETAQSHNKALLERRTDLGAAKVVSTQEVEDAEAAARDSEDQVHLATAQLRQASLNLSYTEIRSPVSGVAGLARVRTGNLVGQDGPTLLTTVSQVDPIRANFPMGEIDYVKQAERLKGLEGRDLAWAQAQFKKLAAGAPSAESLELVLADGSTYAHRGVIVAANRQIDATTGTIQMQALFPNPDHLLRPGQYGRVRMRRRDAGGNVLVVPERALIQVQGTYSLAVVGPGNKVSLRKVEVGPNSGTQRIIASGVNEHDQIVVEGVQKVTDGAVVVPQPMSAAPAAPAPGGAPAAPAKTEGR
jgi:membrane fusion protein (multidrug efflux system)